MRVIDKAYGAHIKFKINISTYIIGIVIGIISSVFIGAIYLNNGLYKI